MKRLFFLTLLFTGLHLDLPAHEVLEPKADDAAEVVCGNARFTVLTSRLIRMEWSEDGVFEDRATLGVVNRNLPLPRFKVSRVGKKVMIRT